MLAKIWAWLLSLLGVKTRRKWHIQNGVPVQFDAEWRPFFWFPNNPPGANYLLTETGGPIRGPYVAMGYTVTTTGNPIFDYRTAANNMGGDGRGNVRLFIQRRGDDLGAQGDKQYYRFWAVGAVRQLEAGSYAISATLDPSSWSSVFGVRGDQAPEQFAATLKDAEFVGVTFGGGSFFGHGCYTHEGSAMFRVDSIYY